MSSPTPTPTLTPTPTITPTPSLLYPVIKRTFTFPVSLSLSYPIEIDELVLDSVSWVPRTENYSGVVGLLSCETFVEEEPDPDPVTKQCVFYSSYFTSEYTDQLVGQYECVENGLTKLNTLSAICYGA